MKKGLILAALSSALAADPCNGVYSTQAACDAVAACTWCKSAAVPSACNTLANAGRLPPGVFACDPKAEWVEVARQQPANGDWVAGEALGAAGGEGSDPKHELMFVIPQHNLDVLQKVHSEVSDPTHSKYGKYLTFKEVGDLVRNEESMDAVRAWLETAGVKACRATEHLEYLRCTAPTSTWNTVLKAKFRAYRGSTLTAATTVRAPAVHVPSSVREHLVGILLASELPPLRTRQPSAQPMVRAEAGYCDSHPCATPALLNKVYNFTTNSGGGHGSQSVFETDKQTMSPADLAAFQKKYTTMAKPQPIAADIGGNVDDNTCKYLTYDCGEASLDIQYIIAQAQDVPTTYWACDQCTFAEWIANVADTASPPLVHSISYGQDEFQTGVTEMDAFSTEAMKLGVKGITVLASSGDDGVAGPKARTSSGLCAYNPQWPASCPYVTTVGATQGPEEGGKPEVVCAATNNNTFITTGESSCAVSPLH